MKKYKNIKIIKEEKSFTDKNYTFIDNINTLRSDNISLHNIKIEQESGNKQPLEILDSNKEDKYKKKKVVNKNDSKSKFDKALKFSNPSQRNHSSVYE
jgi:hypothetical protein